MDPMEESAIRMIGTMIGARELQPLGSVPNSATSSSYVFVTSPLEASSSAVTRFPMNFAYRKPAMSGNTEQSAPMPITISRLFPIPSVFAAAIGPGVGGMNT